MRSKNKIIKVGYLLSYDYKFIFNSIKQIYDFSDEIFICYDKDGKTWTGNDFEIPDTVFSEIRKLDHQNKIIFYSDTFYVEELSAIDLDTRQRNMLAQKMGKGGWHIQIDSDEYLVGFEKLTAFLRKQKYLLRNSKKTPVNFFVNFVTLFKQTEDGFFVISPFTESCFLITNVPEYINARFPQNSYSLKLNVNNIHQSWARTQNEILQKINNWGHSSDFDTSDFYNKWDHLNQENYAQFKNFHPIYPKDWQELKFIPAKGVEEFIVNFEKKYPQQKIKMPLKLKKRIKLYLKSLF
ncbi:hypothetical protein CHRY9390_01877 [Chryseobacterium aquaeductus]|uniref:Uncharacterized protein n=1 Tax=Chryseobacterium aquaeductus TaxID=2675056 RepID=A0A9N8MGN0_9FLAO|nr:hypothetical protein [Chryseobacterium aquaeductus]CAA7331190.1 hypothetical protein CHRY9390_01877 [Chryseobacterium potabilaquae]CAD7808718.1 hypothetical protein CHRY9390_01877 [Chryseobacterium aquaeductus]